MKKPVALILAVFMLVMFSAGIFTAFADTEYKYSLNTSGTVKQFIQGDNVSLRLSVMDNNGASINFCELKARVNVPFEIYNVSYTVAGKQTVAVSPLKPVLDADASNSNPYEIIIDYSPEFSSGSGAADGGANGYVTIAFTISEESATSYKDIKVASIAAYIDEVVTEDPSSGEESSNETSSDDVSSEEGTPGQDESDVGHGDVTHDTQPIVTHTKKQIALEPRRPDNVDGYGSTLRILIQDKDAKNATLSDLTVDGFALSPVFSPDVTSYTVNVDAATTQVRIGAVPKFADAQIAFSSTDASVDQTGLVTLSDKKSQRVRISVTASLSTSSYFITFIKPESTSSVESTVSEDVSSPVGEISDVDSEISDLTSDDTASDLTSETSSDDYAGTVTSSRGQSGGGKSNLIYIILIIILALLCLFVLFMILIRLGVFGKREDDDDDIDVGEDISGFGSKAVNIDAFEKASTTHSTQMNPNYSATRVVRIPEESKTEPRAAQNDGFDFSFEEEVPEPVSDIRADEVPSPGFFTVTRVESEKKPDIQKSDPDAAKPEPKDETIVIAAETDDALDVSDLPTEDQEPKKEEKKKKSFFFDDDFFDEF